MYQYSITQWLFFFYLYCFMGWCFESAYVSISERQLVNRGFMRGPFLPLYGFGAITMLVVSGPFRENLFLTYISGCIGATSLEYLTAVSMECLFKIRYWDYSEKKFNFQGRISLGSTLMWGVFTVGMNFWVQRIIESFSFLIPQRILEILVLVVTIYVTADFALSFKTALDITHILMAMERLRNEFGKITGRLDAMLTANEEAGIEKKGIREMRTEELVEEAEEKFGILRQIILAKPGDYLENFKKEAMDLKERFVQMKGKSLDLKSMTDHLKRAMILGNPGMYSRRFVEVLQELKDAAKKKQKKEEEN